MYKHLQRGEFGVVADATALNGEVGEQYRVRTGFELYAIALDAGNESFLGKVLDRVDRAAAQEPDIGIRDLDPVDSGANGNFSDCCHKVLPVLKPLQAASNLFIYQNSNLPLVWWAAAARGRLPA